MLDHFTINTQNFNRVNRRDIITQNDLILITNSYNHIVYQCTTNILFEN
jgi:hypothetical protein